MSATFQTKFSSSLCNFEQRALLENVAPDRYGSVIIRGFDKGFLCGGPDQTCATLLSGNIDNAEVTITLNAQRFDAAATQAGSSYWWITGGKDYQDNFLNSTETFHNETEGFTFSHAHLPLKLSGHCLLHLALDHFLIAGGENASGLSSQAFLVSSERNVYSHINSMKYARANTFCFKLSYTPDCLEKVTCSNCFHMLIGGGRANIARGLYHQSTEILLAHNWTWHQTRDFPYSIAYAVGVETSAGSFVIGGKSEMLDGSVNVWKLVFQENCIDISWVKTGYILSPGRYHHAAIVLQGHLDSSQCQSYFGMCSVEIYLFVCFSKIRKHFISQRNIISDKK